MRLLAIDQTPDVEESKLFGESYLPEKWLYDDLFSPFEFFIGQINLAKISSSVLPQKGYLYFFIEIISENCNKIKPIVRYCTDEPDAYTDFNEGFFEQDPNCYMLKDCEDGNVLFAEEGVDDVKLLAFPCNFLPFKTDFDRIEYIISKKNLVNCEFDKVELKFLKN